MITYSRICGLCSRLLGLGSRIRGLSCRIRGVGTQIRRLRCRIGGLVAQIHCLGSRICGLGSRITGLGWLAGLSACRHGGSLACWAWPGGPRPKGLGQGRVTVGSGALLPGKQDGQKAAKHQGINVSQSHGTFNPSNDSSQPGGPTRGPADFFP